MKRVLSAVFSVLLILGVPFSAFAGRGVSLSVSLKDTAHDMSDMLYGAFIEDISFACDGGLVSNLVNNNSFEYEFNKTTAWTASSLELSTDEADNPMNANNPTYATLTVDGKGSLTNTGYTEMYVYKTYDRDEQRSATPDMGFKKGEKYDFSCYINNDSFDGSIKVYLDSPSNRKHAAELDISSAEKGKWVKLSETLTSRKTEDGGLTIELDGKGVLRLDFVMLVPENSHGYGNDAWKYTTLRNDLYESMEQLSPKFVRFPGGCLAEGDTLEHLYDWKETIGPLEERVQFYNLWRDDVGRDYINTQAMGYHEYFQLCKDIKAEPVPILNVGLTCQGRCAYDDHAVALIKSKMTDEEWQDYMTNVRNMPEDNKDWRNGYTEWLESLNINSDEDWEKYLDSIALRPGTPEWDAYVRDILDLIEYANGDAETTYWGAKRAENGSAEPFNMKYIGLGNENWGEVYKRNFEALCKEVKKAYPDITVISSASTYFEGEAYEQNMSWINKDYADTIVDEHYYTKDGFLFDINDHYDNFDRNNAKVFIGEYAATAQGVGTLETKSNMYEAVEEASYLTGVERNGDMVVMTSYAPTFAKLNAQCWAPNLIWFDSQEVMPTPSFYTQMLFSNNLGSKYIESKFDNGTTVLDGIYESVTVDEESQTLFIKLVNSSGKKTAVNLSLSDFGDINYVSAQSLHNFYKGACNERGAYTVCPEEKTLAAKNTLKVKLDKYDVTVVRVAYGENQGDSFYTLPDRISTVPAPKKYIPLAIKIAVPSSIGAAALGIAVIVTAVKLVKKHKAKKQNGTEED